jgi:hypothetical protein
LTELYAFIHRLGWVFDSIDLLTRGNPIVRQYDLEVASERAIQSLSVLFNRSAAKRHLARQRFERGARKSN